MIRYWIKLITSSDNKIPSGIFIQEYSDNFLHKKIYIMLKMMQIIIGHILG